MLSRIIAAVVAIPALIFFYLAYTQNTAYGLYIIPFVLIASVALVMAPQIDWWWYLRYPPRMDDASQGFLERYNTFYNALSEDGQEKFRNRVELIRRGKDFKSQAVDEMPEEVRLVVAANFAQLTFGLDDFLLPDFETIIIYPRPFPSPKYPKIAHASEVYEGDGVLMFSAEQLLQSFTQPQAFYNLGLHEVSQALIRSYPDWPWPVPTRQHWELFPAIGGFSKEQVQQYINRPDIEQLSVAIVHYFTFPKAFLQTDPKLFQEIKEVLNQKQPLQG